MPRPLTPLGLEFVAAIPVRLREDPDVEAVMHVYAREWERLRAAREQVAAGLVTPGKAADRVLRLWESLLGLPVAPVGVSVATRQATAKAYIAALLQSGTGRWWEDTVTRIAGPGWTYAEHVMGDAASPPIGTIHITLPQPSGTASYEQTKTLIEQITDAHIALAFFSSVAFTLDQSLLDNAPLV